MTSDGKPYGPQRYKQLVKNCYIVSKTLNTSYIDVRDKMTPSELNQIINLIIEDNEKYKEKMEKMKEEQKLKRENRNIRR